MNNGLKVGLRLPQKRNLKLSASRGGVSGVSKADNDWFYVKGDDSVGPLKSTAMAALLRAGEISGEIYVWREGLSDWVQLKDTELKSKGKSADRGMSMQATLQREMAEVHHNKWGFLFFVVALTLGVLVIGWAMWNDSISVKESIQGSVVNGGDGVEKGKPSKLDLLKQLTALEGGLIDSGKDVAFTKKEFSAWLDFMGFKIGQVWDGDECNVKLKTPFRFFERAYLHLWEGGVSDKALYAVELNRSFTGCSREELVKEMNYLAELYTEKYGIRFNNYSIPYGVNSYYAAKVYSDRFVGLRIMLISDPSENSISLTFLRRDCLKKMKSGGM